MATCLSSSLDSLQFQDPLITCRMRRRQEKLGQGGHGLGHHLLGGHLLPFLSRELWGGHGRSSIEEEVWPSSSKRERSMTMAIFVLLRWPGHIF